MHPQILNPHGINYFYNLFPVLSVILVMKYFSLISILLFVLFSLPIFGQRIFISDEITLRNDYSYELLGRYGDRILLYRNRQMKQQVQFFDEEMNLRNEKEFELDDRRSELIGVVRGDTSFAVIYNYRRKGDIYLCLQEFDGLAQRIDSIQVISVLRDQFLTPEFNLKVSEDRSQAIIYTSEKEREMDLFVVDVNKRELLYTKKLLFENLNFRREFKGVYVSNKGTLFAVLELNNFINKKDKHLFRIFHFVPGMGSVQIKEVSFPGYISLNHEFIVDNTSDCLVGAGFCSEDNYVRTSGVFTIRFCGQDQVQPIQHLSITEDLLVDIYGKNVQIEKGIENAQVRDIILRKDGGLLMIGEVMKEFSRRSYYGERTLNSYNYQSDFHFEDLLVFSIHPDGKTHWSSVLHKKQYSHDDEAIYSSYFLFKNPSKVRLVYNDEISRENTVSEYVIQGNGRMLRNSLINTEYQRLQMRFRDALQISSTEFIVPSQRQLKLNLVRFDYR